MKIRSALVGTVLLAITACSNPLSFGPGRLEIKLEEAAVRAVPHGILFPDSRWSGRVPREHDALVLVVSSEIEVLNYFEERDRELQVRCAVVGNEGGRIYKGFAVGPVPQRESDSANATIAPQGRHRYTVYSFIDLEADDEAYEGGKPATQLDLRIADFSSLRCHLLGVIKAPGLFPRSNDVSVTADTFRALVRKANTE